ncbi:MAG: diadenylate cyclase CdaA [Clostridia bacterium]
MVDFFQDIITQVMRLVSAISFVDVLDIAVVAFLIYYSIKLLRQTRAFQLVKGLSLLLLVNLVITALGMEASSFIFGRLFNDITLVIILLFQPEIRQVIENFGRGNWSFISHFTSRNKDLSDELKECARRISKSASNMSEKRVGALIVVEGKTLLGEIIKTGNEVDAKISTQLIENIFFPNSPLHDGAAVIKNGRIEAAGCILPLTKNEIGKELGTRHRAAVGMSEISDALVIVVSEETGAVSYAKSGELKKDISVGDLRELLIEFLTFDETEKPKRTFTRRKDKDG